MKRLPPSGYVSAEESRKPGYLATRFAMIKRQQAQQKQQAQTPAQDSNVLKLVKDKP